MSPKNLIASSKTHKLLLNKLKDKRTLQIYNKFIKNFKLDEDFAVAVSGGPDSLALSFLAKIYSIKKNLNVKFLTVDHKLRKNSTNEAIYTKSLLKKIFVNPRIVTWSGNKPKSNIQSIAREKRYNLLIKEVRKSKIKNILLGHHSGDLYENFFIRILRGSGLNGLVSFDQNSNYKKINLLRPLIQFDKDDLIYISKKIFQSYIKDSSNDLDKFKRVKIRKLINNLQFEGLDLDKFDLTIKNLKSASQSISFFKDKNISDNVTFLNKKKSAFIKTDFFNYPDEVVFRSISDIIKIIGNKHYPVRGKKITRFLDLYKNNNSLKITLGNCLIKKVSQTLVVTKEHES